MNSVKPTDEQIDYAVSAWHDGGGFGMELYEYLGWSRDEYARWIENYEVPARPLALGAARNTGDRS
ncbi:MAG TPA: hypothetical protein VFU20_01055 [Sphingomicrobium sp.]|nr:hypothetical protein [Sphingomicrobium sp.]